MSETNQFISLAKYRNIFGDTKETIRAIQNFINSGTKNAVQEQEESNEPAASINRIINSNICEDTSADIQKIINNL